MLEESIKKLQSLKRQPNIIEDGNRGKLEISYWNGDNITVRIILQKPNNALATRDIAYVYVIQNEWRVVAQVYYMDNDETLPMIQNIMDSYLWEH